MAQKLISWNLNGIRAVAKKGLIDILHGLNADVYCFQETKAQHDQVIEALTGLEGYHIYSFSAIKKGYSGTAILTKEKPISVAKNLQHFYCPDCMMNEAPYALRDSDILTFVGFR